MQMPTAAVEEKTDGRSWGEVSSCGLPVWPWTVSSSFSSSSSSLSSSPGLSVHEMHDRVMDDGESVSRRRREGIKID